MLCSTHYSARRLRLCRVVRIQPGNLVLEYRDSARHRAAVFLDGLKPPPSGVTAVVPRSYTLVQQVRDQAVPQCASIAQYDVPVT